MPALIPKMQGLVASISALVFPNIVLTKPCLILAI
jgi:hypothetical protein